MRSSGFNFLNMSGYSGFMAAPYRELFSNGHGMRTMSVDLYSPHYTTANARLEALAVPAVSPLPEAIKFLSEIIKETAAQKNRAAVLLFLEISIGEQKF